MNEKVIVALDFENTRRALEFLELFQEQKLFLKVGMELFYAGGSDFLRVLKEKGHRVFLDLKLHDIPNTVERTMRVLTRLGVDMVNLHAAGGKAMMEAAVRGLTRPDGTRPVLLAVTQLTSTDDSEYRGGKTPRRPRQRRPAWTVWSARRWKPMPCTARAAKVFLRSRRACGSRRVTRAISAA